MHLCNEEPGVILLLFCIVKSRGLVVPDCGDQFLAVTLELTIHPASFGLVERINRKFDKRWHRLWRPVEG